MAVATALMLCISCGKNPNEPTAKSYEELLVGEWNLTEILINDVDDTEGFCGEGMKPYVYSFNAEGSGTLSLDWWDETETLFWSIEGDVLTMLVQGYDYEYDILQLDENTLKLREKAEYTDEDGESGVDIYLWTFKRM